MKWIKVKITDKGLERLKEAKQPEDINRILGECAVYASFKEVE